MELTANNRPKSDMRVQVVCVELRELANKKGPDGQLPSVRRLCDSFGASEVTINEALNELENRGVIYRNDVRDIFVSPRIRCKRISFVLGTQFFHMPGASPFWDLLWGLFVKEAEKRSDNDRDFTFHIATPTHKMGEPLQEGLIKMIESGQIHGVVGVGLTHAAWLWLQASKVPFVAFAGPAACVVGTDVDEEYRLGVDCLVGAGCRRIALWAPASPHDYHLPEERARAEFHPIFVECLKKHGLAIDPSLIRQCWHLLDDGRAEEEIQDDWEAGFRIMGTYQEQGYNTAMDVFGNANGVKPDGIFIRDDMMTSGALAAFRHLGIRVGVDVQVASHANKGSIVLFGHEHKMFLTETDPADVVSALMNCIELVMAGKTPTERDVTVIPKLHLPTFQPLSASF